MQKHINCVLKLCFAESNIDASGHKCFGKKLTQTKLELLEQDVPVYRPELPVLRVDSQETVLALAQKAL